MGFHSEIVDPRLEVYVDKFITHSQEEIPNTNIFADDVDIFICVYSNALFSDIILVFGYLEQITREGKAK